jgi:hypothetical protein
MPFDIGSLATFSLAKYQCEKCRGLLQWSHSFVRSNDHTTTCPMCRVAYLPTKQFPYIDRYLDRHGPVCLNTKEALAQAQQLAEIVARMRGYQKEPISSPYAYTPLRGLLEVLSIAQKFVHFTTYGAIPHLLIGALKVTAQHMPVRGIVSGAKGELLSENTVSELTNYPDEAPAMDVKIYDPSLTGWKSMPHQKLIIIDGLLAFKGSANLSLSGWRKAAEGRDTVDVVTDIDRVIEINNRLFAPIWAELSDIGETIDMSWFHP